MKPYILLPLISVCVLTTGCASFGLGEPEYACKGYPNSPTCMSAREVYDATNYKDSIANYGDKNKEEAADNNDDDFGDYDEDYIDSDSKKQNTRQDIDIAMPQQATYLPRMKGPTPVRAGSKVMRIWIAPWEDTEGDLHTPGIVYKEIEGRRWTFGEYNDNSTRHFAPLSKGYRDPG